MSFWLVSGLVTLLCAGALVWRLGIARLSAAASRGSFDRTVYKDQLAELQRDLERGVLSAEAAETARLEIQRRLLATDTDEAPVASDVRPDAIMAVAVAGLVSALSLAIYLSIGSPRLGDAPLAERTAAGATAGGVDLGAKVAALEARLKREPQDAEAWLLLGRAYVLQQRFADASDAYRRAMSLADPAIGSEAASGYGETLVIAADGVVTPAARAAFGEAVAKDPNNASARYYLGLADAQAGKPAEALAGWRALLADSPPDAPWLSMLREQMTKTAAVAGLPPPDLAAGTAPSAAAGAASMSGDERQKMIRGMVDGLAAKLDKDPGDVAGWARLANAYRVLGEMEKAAEAERRGVAALPPAAAGAAGIPALLQRAHFLLEASGASRDLRRPLPDDLVATLRDVAERDPDQPEALWYLGLAAAQQHDVKTAIADWQRLLRLLPQGTNEYKTVEAALAALQAPK